MLRTESKSTNNSMIFLYSEMTFCHSSRAIEKEAKLLYIFFFSFFAISSDPIDWIGHLDQIELFTSQLNSHSEWLFSV